jgi:hypothetical protein
LSQEHVVTSSTPAEDKTVNQQAGLASSDEISSLARYRAQQQKGSSPSAQPQTAGGEASPETGAAQAQPSDNREQFIPRHRFDEVNAQRNQYAQQLQALQAQLAMYQQAQGITGMQGQLGHFQQAPAQPTVTGMANSPQAQASQVPQIPDFNDPAVVREWRDRIANNPVTGLRDFVSLLIRAEGVPLLEQFRQQITSQLTPLQQTFVQQQLTSYAQSRASDPQFTAIQPIFNQLVQQAVQRGYQLTPQVLSTIEHIARVQAPQYGITLPASDQAPFTERPGSGGQGFPAPEMPQLTPMQEAMARRFGMTPAEYARRLKEIG